MTQRGRWLSGIAFVIVVGLITLASSGKSSGPSDASSFSKGSSGWSAARAYLENQGAYTETLDQPVSEGLPLSEGGVLVVAGAASHGFSEKDLEAVNRFLGSGGRVVFGYGQISERRASLRGNLDVEFVKSQSLSTSLNPFTWRREAFETRRYPTAEGLPDVALYPVSAHPVSVAGDTVLLRDEEDEALVILRPKGKGELVILPSELLSNGRLTEPGNAALLESLMNHFDAETPWYFDEYHHGIARPSSPVGLKSRRALDLFVIQIIIAYVLFVIAIGRRFGPGWPEPRPASGATSTFLMTVAAVHDRLGHHEAAAVVLRERAAEVLGIEVRPRPQSASARPGQRAGSASSRDALQTVARDINDKQQEGRHS